MQLDNINMSTCHGSHQSIEFRIIAEERVVVLLLVMYKRLDVDVKVIGRRTLRGACRLLTLLKQQSHQREERVAEREEGD